MSDFHHEIQPLVQTFGKMDKYTSWFLVLPGVIFSREELAIRSAHRLSSQVLLSVEGFSDALGYPEESPLPWGLKL